MRAAREVFSELGYDAATFQAIAIRADLTRPAINHYFASKRLLYREVVEQTNAMVVAAGMARAQGQTSCWGGCRRSSRQPCRPTPRIVRPLRFWSPRCWSHNGTPS